MSNPGTSKISSLVITGNPTVDTYIRNGLLLALPFLTGVITGWLNSHGIVAWIDANPWLSVIGLTSSNWSVYLDIGVASGLVSLVLAIWGIILHSKNEVAVKLRELAAVQAGIAVAESATPTPTVQTVADAQKVIAQHTGTL